MTRPHPSQDLDDPTRARLSPTALKFFLHIVDQWGLSPVEASALLDRPVPLAADAAETLTTDQLYRCGLLIEIYVAVHQLYSDEIAGSWLQRRNDALSRETPLQCAMENGLPGLEEILQLLRARQQGW
jgi:hypothetical protein